MVSFPLIFRQWISWLCIITACSCGSLLKAQTISIDTTAPARAQTIDGFGTCISGTEGESNWWQSLFFDDLQGSILRMDLTPTFKSPYSDFTYNSPWFHNNPALPGPEGNNVRTYTNATDYTRLYSGRRAQIAVMGPNIDENIRYFDFNSTMPRVAGKLAKLGASKRQQLGDFKLIASLWSPAPWVKISSGNTISGQSGILPVNGTAWPFIWGGNFAGGKLDTSGIPLPEFDDSSLGGTGPTSALTQFARGMTAFLRGFQQTNQVRFYAISIQNELNFEEFYNSCTYPLSAGYIIALKVIRTELNKYPDLADIKIMGPEDLLGGDPYGMWQYGGGSTTIHKNLQYLQNIGADVQASNALGFFCIHGYASDGVNAANATPTSWNWWANGWSSSPAAGIPANVKGFRYYGRKSWMTETSGEDPSWLAPATGFPGNGAWSIALRIHQALTTGEQSAWVYWQLTDGNAVGAQTLTSSALTTNSAKYVAAKHFFRFIRPGSVRVGATVSGTTNLLASAYLNETNGSITAVVINTSATSQSATVSIPQPPSGLNLLHSFTSANGSLWQPGTMTLTNGSGSLSVPGYGVVTLNGVSPPKLTLTQQSGGKLQLSWTPDIPGAVLQSSPALGLANTWSNEPSTYSISNGIGSTTVSNTASARFYRLVLP